ncbi:MAG TPA: hypothetical protein VLL48_02410 [Longimicrobiales bacterium]|nr:hypothetical protein [Longimicrobiales bacterium]
MRGVRWGRGVMLGGLWLGVAACAANLRTARPAAGSGEGCRVEAYNDTDSTITAWYDDGRASLGVLAPREAVEFQADCLLERIVIRGRELHGGRDLIPAVVSLEEGELKIANLRLPRM